MILLSGSAMAPGAMQPKEKSDINFFVSGAIGSKDTSTRGTAVFGGDVFVSGSLFARQSQVFVFTENISTTAEHYIGFGGTGLASTGFTVSRHQFLAPYGGSVK